MFKLDKSDIDHMLYIVLAYTCYNVIIYVGDSTSFSCRKLKNQSAVFELCRIYTDVGNNYSLKKSIIMQVKSFISMLIN